MKYEKVKGSIFDLKEEFEKGELWIDVAGYGLADDFFGAVTENLLVSAISTGTLYRKVKPKKTYKGVELPEWADRLTWDESGKCFAWCEKAKLHKSDSHMEWVNIYEHGFVWFICGLTKRPFTDDSWKDSLIKL